MYSLTKLTSSNTIEDFHLDRHYDEGMELKARIFKARTDAKMTQEELAKAVGKTRGAVAQWESGEVRPRHTTLTSIAAATGKDLSWLLNGIEEHSNRIGLKVVGEVAAGMWKEGSVYFDTTIEPVASHPDYPAHAQRLYRVSGNSINRIAENGEYLHTVDIHTANLKPDNGDLVIVRRRQHDLAEYTAKTLAFVEGRWVLRPESFDSEWQQDIEINGDDSTEIEITDIVIAKWKPIARRRPIVKPFVDPFK